MNNHLTLKYRMDIQDDLVGVAVFTLTTLIVVFAPTISESPARTVITGTFLFTIPGYVATAVLFPESCPTTKGINADRIDLFERIAMSIPLSLIIVAAVGLMVSFSPVGFTLASVLITLCMIVSAGLLVAHVRRQLIDHETVYTPTLTPEPLTRFFREYADNPPSIYRVASIIIALVLIISAVAGVGYIFTVPGQGETYTELYILNASTDTNGYPRSMNANELQRIRVGISNHEQHSVQYTVISELQRVRNDNSQFRIIERQRLGEYSVSVDSNQTWERQDRFRPRIQDDRLRLIYYLYHESPPEIPTTETAAQEVHLWVNVTAS
jgi:uncharacterized membrane protein